MKPKTIASELLTLTIQNQLEVANAKSGLEEIKEAAQLFTFEKTVELCERWKL